MENNSITISAAEYRELIEKSVQIEIIKTMLTNYNYINKKDVANVLGVEVSDD